MSRGQGGSQIDFRKTSPTRINALILCLSTPATAFEPDTNCEYGRALTYAFSKDGINWIRPKLDLVTYNGEPTNILLQLQNGKFVQYASVIIDSNRNKTYPYEMFILAQEEPLDFFNITKQNCLGTNNRCLYRYFSKDGIKWIPMEVVNGFPSKRTSLSLLALSTFESVSTEPMSTASSLALPRVISRATQRPSFQ